MASMNFSIMVLPSLIDLFRVQQGVRAAIAEQDDTVDAVGLLGNQEYDRAGDVCGIHELVLPIEGGNRQRHHRHPLLGRELRGHRGFHIARCNRVNPNAVGGPVRGHPAHPPGQRMNAGFMLTNIFAISSLMPLGRLLNVFSGINDT